MGKDKKEKEKQKAEELKEKIEKRAGRICKRHFRKGVTMDIAREAAPRALQITSERIKAFRRAVLEHEKREIKDAADKAAIKEVAGIDIDKRNRRLIESHPGGSTQASWRDYGRT